MYFPQSSPEYCPKSVLDSCLSNPFLMHFSLSSLSSSYSSLQSPQSKSPLKMKVYDLELECPHKGHLYQLICLDFRKENHRFMLALRTYPKSSVTIGFMPTEFTFEITFHNHRLLINFLIFLYV
jgi:hypothetical protein